MHRRITLSAVSLLATLFLVGAALLLTAGPARASGPDQAEACLACHPRSFAGEVHGLGTTNPVFKAGWDKEGNPKECLVCHVTDYDAESGTWKSDTISCEACHGPIPEDHPTQAMPVDKSNQLCAKCHNDSRFGWDDWKTSVHYQQDMTCSTCHDPHLPKRSTDENVSAYCENCHVDITKRAEHSTHAQAGVSCISCHLGPKKGVDEFHKVPDHSFKPVVETCNACHVQQMHDMGPTPVVTATLAPTMAVPTATSQPVLINSSQTESGANTSPFNTLDLTFMGAGLLGLGAVGGLALSPVLDWINHLFSKPRK